MPEDTTTDTVHVTPSFDELIAAWDSYREASAIMRAGKAPTWPWSLDAETHAVNLRNRDRVQGRGMHFAMLWLGHADDIRHMVDDNRELFAEYHVIPAKGVFVPDPVTYMQSITIMPRLIALVTSPDA